MSPTVSFASAMYILCATTIGLAAGAIFAACPASPPAPPTAIEPLPAPQDAQLAKAQSIVQAIYDVYIANDDKARPSQFDKRQGLSKKLKAALARADTLDWDPPIDGQDYDLKSVDLRAAREAGAVVVHAKFIYWGTPTEVAWVFVEEAGELRIDNLRTKDWDLAELLANSAAAKRRGDTQ